MTTAFITHGDYLLHEMGADHPERPERIGAITQYLASSELGDQLKWLAAQPVPEGLLEKIHPVEYISWLDSLQPKQGLVYADPDTALNPHTMRAARLAAGAVTMATQMVLEGKLTNAFCAVRPPGHHAERSIAMGFCFFNNIALGVEQALSHRAIERVAILDFDVHHCNGTVDIFKDRPEVLVCSTFQHPFFPHRYYDIQRDNIINSPLPAGTTGNEFRQAVERDWLPALHCHQPQMIFVSAGFDAHQADPLGQLLLDESDYRWVTQLIVNAASCFASGRIVSVLEGGYDLQALAHSVYTHLEGLVEG
ncbi:histone deacetylase family protein [Photobacterium sp. SDRW27]|uniref:histone deacetylase family protein n=1 Tax=Photobacterium obscurum TaxID=2829490 RepID=UPI0022433645|nr:histone deacetylase family protein [Photobacterium obscurum]MCW8327963.1 histone deacetylase family protein [Photobacterium obscurum]